MVHLDYGISCRFFLCRLSCVSSKKQKLTFEKVSMHQDRLATSAHIRQSPTEEEAMHLKVV